jgi:hypothetical protein
LRPASPSGAFNVDVKKPEEVQELTRYDAFVVGSAIYLGRWLKPAETFVEGHAGELSEHPTWLFSSGPIAGDRPTADPQDATMGGRLSQSVHAREHKVFAGKLDKSKLNWCERVAVRSAHAREAITATGRRSRLGSRDCARAPEESDDGCEDRWRFRWRHHGLLSDAFRCPPTSRPHVRPEPR